MTPASTSPSSMNDERVAEVEADGVAHRASRVR